MALPDIALSFGPEGKMVKRASSSPIKNYEHRRREDFWLWARSDERTYRHESESEKRQSTKPKGPQPGGFHQKPGGDFVAPQSKIHKGYSLSSRLVGARFL